jgi:hypothetical protein
MHFDSPPGELLSRFIFHKSRIRYSNKTVKYTAFEPPPSCRLSVYWTSGLLVSEIWKICAEYVAPIYGKPAIARADLNSLNVYTENLAIELTGIPHPRHTDIVGWDLESTRTRLQALKLASASSLVESPL